MGLSIEPPGEWEEAGWKVTDPTNYQHHILEINNEGNREITLWLSGINEYRILVGTGTEIPEKEYVDRKKYEDKEEAIMEAIKFARSHPTLRSMKEFLK